MSKRFKKMIAVVSAIAMVVVGIAYTPQMTSAVDEYQKATDTWTTGLTWNIWAGNNGAAQYKGADVLNDYYVNIEKGAGAWSVQAATEITDLKAGVMYEYTITVDSDKEGAYVGTKDDLSNSSLVYTTLKAGSNELKGTFTAAASSKAKMMLELGNEANTGATLHITGVTVEEYVSHATVEYDKNIVENSKWLGWFEKEGWANYAISEIGTGYTLTDKNIGENWYSVQTGIDNVEFLQADYVCEFTLTAAAPKKFKVDNRTNDAIVFNEVADGDWTQNEADGTYSYKYKGTFKSDKNQIINVRVSLGHFAEDSETYGANATASFTLSDFTIYAVAPQGGETSTEAAGETSTAGGSVEPSTVPEAAAYDWDSVEFLGNGTTDANNTNMYKAVAKEGTDAGIVNVQENNGANVIYMNKLVATKMFVNGVESAEVITAGDQQFVKLTAFTDMYNDVQFRTDDGTVVGTVYVYYKNGKYNGPQDPVESSTPAEVESSTPAEVESSTPAEVESSTPSEVESSTPSEVESSTPSEVESTTPDTKVTTAPQVTTTAPKTTTTAPKKALGKTTVKKVSKKLSAKKVKITFKKVKGAKKYQVQISTTKKFKKVLVKKTVKKVKVTITSKKLANKKKLYVRVKAVGAKKWSKVKKIKIKK